MYASHARVGRYKRHAPRATRRVGLVGHPVGPGPDATVVVRDGVRCELNTVYGRVVVVDTRVWVEMVRCDSWIPFVR